MSRRGETARRIADLADDGLTAQAIADVMGVGRDNVYRSDRNHGIRLAADKRGPKKPRERGAADVERYRNIEAMRRMGATLEQIGNRFGITRERVRQLLERNNGPTSKEISVTFKHREWRCEICGQVESIKLRAKRIPHHQKCAILAKGEIVVRRRIAGERWTEIATAKGGRSTNYSIEARWAKTYLDHHNSPERIRKIVFPGRGKPQDELSKARMRQTHFIRHQLVAHPYGERGAA